MKLKTFRGMSLIEVMVAVLILSLISSGIFLLITGAGRSSMDSYYEHLALQLAREPLEIFRAFGYERLLVADTQPIADYQINQWQSILKFSSESGIDRPEETESFERFIELQKQDSSPVKGILVKVTIRPKPSGKASAYSSRHSIEFTGVVWEQPQ
ncbi:MAG: prepilin-type N-terminal cleavage/methylation domain-containing protein [Candidatus Riflebacteria bacterium]